MSYVDEKVVCQCGVDLLTDFCFCETDKKEVQQQVLFSPEVMKMALDLQRKIDKVKKEMGSSVVVQEMRAIVSYNLSDKNACRIFGEQVNIPCTTVLYSMRDK